MMAVLKSVVHIFYYISLYFCVVYTISSFLAYLDRKRGKKW